MRFDILTIFPDFFDSAFRFGILGKAIERNLLKINIHNIRDYCSDKHKTVDDRPYGGGSGMVLKAEPISKAIDNIKSAYSESTVILLSPRGKVLKDNLVRELAEKEHIILICGRYEGIDERVRDLFVDMDISVGDYILSGGEYAALSIIDSVSRYVPSILGNVDSVKEESFSNNLLEYPQYTRPKIFKGLKVPEVLLSGNHKDIEKWRRSKQIKITFSGRNDLMDSSKLDLEEIREINDYKNRFSKKRKLYIALIHYPVYNKRLEIVKTSFTNIDVLDIARSSKTYGVKQFYLVHPVNEQIDLIKRVVDHWTEGKGYKYNSSRSESLENVRYAKSIEDIILDISKIEGRIPYMVSTDARYSDKMIGYTELKQKIENEDQPYLLLFGTGYGLTKEVINNSDYILKPITGNSEYNHLSVRCAASIILDRLCAANI